MNSAAIDEVSTTRENIYTKEDKNRALSLIVWQMFRLPFLGIRPLRYDDQSKKHSASESDSQWEQESQELIAELLNDPEYHFQSEVPQQQKHNIQKIKEICELTHGKRYDLQELKEKRPQFVFHTYPPPTYSEGIKAKSRVVMSLHDVLELVKSEDPLFKSFTLGKAVETLKKNLFLADLATQSPNLTLFRFGREEAPYRYGAFKGTSKVHDFAEYVNSPMSWWQVLTPEGGMSENALYHDRNARHLFVTTIGELEKEGKITVDYVDNEALVFVDLTAK